MSKNIVPCGGFELGESLIMKDGKLDLAEGGSVTVDSALSATSTNPVQNKVVTAALDAKLDAPAETVSVETILPETTITFATNGEVKQSDVFINLEFGKEYTVVFDGVSYNIQCIANENAFWVGNRSDSFDEYPFAVVSSPKNGSFISASTAGEHTFYISGEFNHSDKIPGKFIADVLFVFKEEAK